jgi:cytochrome bd ubiquinol oxidase subunit I
LVYGVLTTAQAAADIPTPMLGATLAMYLLLYAGLLVAYVTVVFHMARKAGYLVYALGVDAKALAGTSASAPRTGMG